MSLDAAPARTSDFVAAQPFFACRGLNAYYGDSYVVQNVSFTLGKGEILALLGRNGAGKTSTLRAIARASTPVLRSGEVYLDSVALHSKRNYQAARAGMQLVQEDRRIIPGLTVEQNLQLATISGKSGTLPNILALLPRPIRSMRVRSPSTACRRRACAFMFRSRPSLPPWPL